MYLKSNLWKELYIYIYMFFVNRKPNVEMMSFRRTTVYTNNCGILASF